MLSRKFQNGNHLNVTNRGRYFSFTELTERVIWFPLTGSVAVTLTRQAPQPPSAQKTLVPFKLTSSRMKKASRVDALTVVVVSKLTEKIMGKQKIYLFFSLS